MSDHFFIQNDEICYRPMLVPFQQQTIKAIFWKKFKISWTINLFWEGTNDSPKSSSICRLFFKETKKNSNLTSILEIATTWLWKLRTAIDPNPSKTKSFSSFKWFIKMMPCHDQPGIRLLHFPTAINKFDSKLSSCLIWNRGVPSKWIQPFF